MSYPTYEEVYKHIEDTESEDETIDMLKEAMEHYCGNYDICEGYKHALRMTLDDQYQNHNDEQSPDDLVELNKILTKTTT